MPATHPTVTDATAQVARRSWRPPIATAISATTRAKGPMRAGLYAIESNPAKSAIVARNPATVSAGRSR